MLKKFLKSGFAIAVLVAAQLNLATGNAIAQQAEASLEEDKLDTIRGIRWGGRGLPYSKVTDIKDSLIGNVLGRVVLDRHGIDRSYGSTFIKSPFSSPEPVKIVFVSLWGSKIDGCFAELIIQVAPPSQRSNSQASTNALVPKILQLGVNGKIIELVPQASAKPRIYSNNYTYTEYKNDAKLKRSSTWYMARNLFRIDANVANVLRNAPEQEVRARVIFNNDESLIYKIGKKTVKRWDRAFNFNPSCSNQNQVMLTPQKPAFSAFPQAAFTSLENE